MCVLVGRVECLTFVHHVHHSFYRRQCQSLHVISNGPKPSHQHPCDEDVEEDGEEGGALVVCLVTDDGLVEGKERVG